MAPSTTLGNLVRQVPIQLHELPPHPAFRDLDCRADRPSGANACRAERPPLISFIKEILEQATGFTDEILPSTFSKRKEKGSSPAVAPVTILKREIDSQQLSQIPWTTGTIPRRAAFPSSLHESWFARRSIHANNNQNGTANFTEFERGLLVNHSENEQSYTPDCYDARPILNWDLDTASHDFLMEHPYSSVRMCSMHPFLLHTHEMCRVKY